MEVAIEKCREELHQVIQANNYNLTAEEVVKKSQALDKLLNKRK